MDDGTRPLRGFMMALFAEKLGLDETRNTHFDEALVTPPTTRCKHGTADCDRCGTSGRRDVIHTARTPGKREARRRRRKGK